MIKEELKELLRLQTVLEQEVELKRLAYVINAEPEQILKHKSTISNIKRARNGLLKAIYKKIFG